jgi:uncharacterized membrane protein HdeD (DUF308 family)
MNPTTEPIHPDRPIAPEIFGDADARPLLHNWWAVVLRGAVAILFSLVMFTRPAISLKVLVLAFGAYAFADGVLSLISAFRRQVHDTPRWYLVLEGIIGIAAGVLTFFWPAISLLVLLYVIAARAIVGGVLEIVAAVRLRRMITNEVFLGLAGLASIAFGVMLVFAPAVGALALVFWLGAYALLFGIALVMLGLKLRSWGKGSTRGTEFRGTHGPLGTAGGAR